jgi:chaperonin GroEL
MALENAVSVAGVLLLTEATLTDLPEPKAHEPSADMGGLDRY